MAEIKVKALRLLANRLIKYVYKKPEQNMAKIVRIAKKATKGMFPQKSFDAALSMIEDKNNPWHDYLIRAINDVDRELLRKALVTFAIDLGYKGTKAVRSNREIYHCNIPWVVLMDPTSACNLKCKGCWAAEYGHKSNLSLNDMRKVIRQSKELGTHFFMFTGGEPLVKKAEILTLAKENPDCIFLAFTNGTLVDDEFCEKLKECGNFGLALSIEGTQQTNDERRGEGVYEKTINAMKLLKKHKCIFGVSVCYTGKNCEAVTSDEFFRMIVENGAFYAWYFHFMPVGINNNYKELLLTPEQRELVYRRIRAARSSKDGKGIFCVDFQNDAEFVGGCIAGGRNYFHVNSEGDIEPCVFVHYSDSNIKEKSILEALQSPLFMEYYKGQPFNDNMLQPCPMLENPEKLRGMVKRSGAKSTNLLAPESAEELCSKCDDYAKAWAPSAKQIWEEKERFHPYTQYYRDNH